MTLQRVNWLQVKPIPHFAKWFQYLVLVLACFDSSPVD